MGSNLEGVWLFRTAVLFMCIFSVQAECIYWYTEQPPPQLFCDPFGFIYLTLSCAVVVNISTTQSDLNIEWYYSSPNDGVASLISRFDFPPVGPSSSNSSFIGLVTKIDIETTLMLAGNYYCQAVTEEGERLQQTTQLQVEQRQGYIGVPFCPTGTSLSDFTTVTCAQGNIPSSNPPPSMYTTNIPPVFEMVNRHIPLVKNVMVFSALVGCHYQYVKEPRSDITNCNPYTSPQQSIECNILIDTFAIPFSQVQIQWLYVMPNDSKPVSLGMFRYVTTGWNSETVVESYLEIINLRPGTYYCQPSVVGYPPLLPSSMAVISTPDSYTALPACDSLSQTSVRCTEDVGNLDPPLFVGASDFTSQGRTIDMDNLIVQIPPDATIEPLPTITPRPAPTDSSSTALDIWVFVVIALGVMFVVLLTVAVSIVCCCCLVKRLKGRKRRRGFRPGKGTGTVQNTASLLPRNASSPTSTHNNASDGHYSTLDTEGSIHYYSYPQWQGTSVAENSEGAYALSRTYTYPNGHYFLASSQRRESQRDNISYLSSSYVIEPGTTPYEEPVTTKQPMATETNTSHGYKDLDASRMDGEHRYTDINQETVARERNECHTTNPTLRENQPSTLPGGLLGMKVKGSNQCGSKSLPAERSADHPYTYQGLKTESMDYMSVYNVRNRTNKEQKGT